MKFILILLISINANAIGTTNCESELVYSTRSNVVVYFEYHTGRFVMESIDWGYQVQLVEDESGWHMKEIRGLITEAVMNRIKEDAQANGFGEI